MGAFALARSDVARAPLRRALPRLTPSVPRVSSETLKLGLSIAPRTSVAYEPIAQI